MRTDNEIADDLAQFDTFGRGPWLQRLAGDVGDLLAEIERLRTEAVLNANVTAAHAQRADAAEAAVTALNASLAASQVAADDIGAAVEGWRSAPPTLLDVQAVVDLAAAVANPVVPAPVTIDEGFTIEPPTIEPPTIEDQSPGGQAPPEDIQPIEGAGGAMPVSGAAVTPPG